MINIKYHNCVQYPEFVYTKDGQIWYKDLSCQLVLKLDNNGIYTFEFISNGSSFSIICVHLFMELYFGKLLDLPIRYRDGNSLNFSSENLYYDIPLSKIAQFESPYTKVVSLGGSVI